MKIPWLKILKDKKVSKGLGTGIGRSFINIVMLPRHVQNFVVVGHKIKKGEPITKREAWRLVIGVRMAVDTLSFTVYNSRDDHQAWKQTCARISELVKEGNDGGQSGSGPGDTIEFNIPIRYGD